MAHSRQTFWVNAFTQTPFSGNPAVVIPQADGLSDSQMQLIAREMNCSETAFVSQPTVPEADFQLRWFTPTQEVDLCGHATIATLHVLTQLALFNLHRGTQHVLFVQTRSGVLRVAVDFTQANTPWIWLTVPPSSFAPVAPPLVNNLLEVLGCVKDQNLPEAVIDSVNQDVLLAIPQLRQLHLLAPAMEALTQLGKRESWRGICVYSLETLEAESAAHLRFFAPQSGIPEDPVTGSASGALAQWLAHKTPPTAQSTNEKMRFRFEQGDCLGRSGRVWVEVIDQTTKVGGQAITIMQGELLA